MSLLARSRPLPAALSTVIVIEASPSSRGVNNRRAARPFRAAVYPLLAWLRRTKHPAEGTLPATAATGGTLQWKAHIICVPITLPQHRSDRHGSVSEHSRRPAPTP